MDGENASASKVVTRLTILMRIPAELVVLVDRYQTDRKLISRNEALRELLESHPQILTRAAKALELMQNHSHPS